MKTREQPFFNNPARGRSSVGVAVLACLLLAGALWLSLGPKPAREAQEIDPNAGQVQLTPGAVEIEEASVHPVASRVSVGRRVRIWLDDGETKTPFLGSARLEYVLLSGSAAATSASTQVEGGTAVLTESSAGPSSAILQSITFNGDQAIAQEGAWVQLDQAGEHRAEFFLPRPWQVRVVAEDTGAVPPGLQIRSGVEPWHGTESPVLSRAANKQQVPAPADGNVTLKAMPGGVYWFGAPGYAWQPYRWDRRRVLGHHISLSRAALIVLKDPEVGSEQRARVVLRGCGSLDYGKVLETYPWEGPQLRIDPLGPGDLVMNVYVGGDQVPVWSERLSLAPGEQREVLVRRRPALNSLHVTLAFDGPGEIPTDEPLLHLLDMTATWAPSGKSGTLRAAHIQHQASGMEIVWRDVRDGEYALQLGELHFLLNVKAHEQPGTLERTFQVPRKERQSVFFVDADTGSPLDVSMLQWSWHMGELDLPTGVLLPGVSTALVQEGLWEHDLPHGMLKLLVISSNGARVWSGALGGGADPTVVEMQPDFRCVLVRDIENVMGMPTGLLRDVQFSRNGQLVPRDQIFLGVGGSHGEARATRGNLTVIGAVPDRVRLPSVDGVSTGGWLDLPRGKRSVTINMTTGTLL